MVTMLKHHKGNLGAGRWGLVLSVCLLVTMAAFTFQAKVYYGKLDGAKKPAEVEAIKVFQAIPEFKEIVDRGLSKGDPEYFALLNKANTKFFNAVRKAAQDSDRDVVVEKGSSSFEGEVTDLTQKAIDSIAN